MITLRKIILKITFARHQDIEINQYYFSSDGEIPIKPFDNFKKDNIKNYINKEFSIDDNVVFPYGGKQITKNSKISARYFMLFNTQRRDTLSNKDVLFDKQNGSKNIRYIEALERIFDIVLGVTTIENLKKIEMLKEKEKELNRLISKEELYQKKKNEFSSENSKLFTKAKGLKLIDENINEEECLNILSKKIESLNIDYKENLTKLSKYQEEKLLLELKRSKYKKYKNQYAEYKNLLKKDLDSLKPIEYLKKDFKDILSVNNADFLIEELSIGLKSIKKFLNIKKYPAIIELDSIIKELTRKIENINKKIDILSDIETSNNITQKRQLLFLGEVKAKLSLYSSKSENINYKDKISGLSKNIKLLEKDIDIVDRTKAITVLNDLMYQIFDNLDYELGGYEDYRPFFETKSKLVFLKKIDDFISQSNIYIKNIGSSSNHLFLHLTFFLSIHRLFIKQNVPFIPSFLILDQPDSPYYSVDNIEEKDVFFKALKMLDEHIDYFNNELKEDFQIIVLEHVEWKEIKEKEFKNYHLVEEWREEGDGLIPKNLKISKTPSERKLF